MSGRSSGRAAVGAADVTDPGQVPAAARTRGTTVIADRVVERTVAAAIASVPGTITAGGALNRIAGRTYPRIDVQVNSLSRAVSVETDVAVSWPSPVRDIARAVRETVHRWVADHTGLIVIRVDVRVGIVSGTAGDAPRARVSRAELDAHDSSPRVRRPVAKPLEPTRHHRRTGGDRR